ncbi:hypothetical protein [Paenibacillus ginsengihumi]|uniref:hypothetical protein n=1 Tax=Paenibacillus ginsengihumi TaxID=431596 RepID=UPI00039F0717|nr:hypothetical protein [Paenibacillus ginsengihumi]
MAAYLAADEFQMEASKKGSFVPASKNAEALNVFAQFQEAEMKKKKRGCEHDANENGAPKHAGIYEDFAVLCACPLYYAIG